VLLLLSFVKHKTNKGATETLSLKETTLEKYTMN